MVKQETVITPAKPGDSEPQGQTILGIAPATVVLVVGATCLVGLVWGVVDNNWVLVATEAPATLALFGVWLYTRAHQAGNRVAIIASAIGSLCAVELWIATAVLDVRGAMLAAIVAASTGATVAVGGIWAIWSGARRDRTTG